MELSDLRPVRDIELKKPFSISEIIDEMRDAGGFVGRNLAEGVEILTDMMKNELCTKFLSFPAAPVATGLRGILKEAVRLDLFDVIVTTCGTLDHDLARSWGDYYEGSFDLDDRVLHEEGYHRLGNVIVPREAYGPMLEKKLQPFFKGLYDEGVRELSSVELCKRLGEYLKDERSILYWAWKNGIPIVIPGLSDGAVGSQVWLFSQIHRDFKIDILKDEQLLSEIIFDAKSTGALIIGGGISKHHVLWWNQFRGGLDYAVYITTAVEYDGSLSGAQIKEAISWGKVKARARQVTIHGEATALLPFMVAALIEKADL
ncbi:MAG: deoxyhypusine synthase [archaeon]|nr:deoxyhypusine synthase [archaeon]MCP8306684.1 deoxyhypusine synthase [archaeon]